jgi:hypothetical protein
MTVDRFAAKIPPHMTPQKSYKSKVKEDAATFFSVMIMD